MAKKEKSDIEKELDKQDGIKRLESDLYAEYSTNHNFITVVKGRVVRRTMEFNNFLLVKVIEAVNNIEVKVELSDPEKNE